MTEQNKYNLEQIYSLVQSLVKNQTTNQYAMTRNNTQDKECQCEPKIKEDINNGNVLREENTKEVTTNNAKNDDRLMEKSTNDAKLQWCSRCHCKDSYSAHTLVLHKSYSSHTVGEQIHHPLRSTEQDSLTNNAHSVGRNEGMDCVQYSPQEDYSPWTCTGRDDLIIVGKPDIPIMELSKLYPPPVEVTSPRTSSARQLNSEHDTCPQMFQTFSLTTCGKPIFNCNSSKESKLDCKYDKNMELKSVYRNIYDNYDTSGYATEPEDNNDPAASNSARKKLQKKASKQQCRSQTLLPIGQNNSKENHGSQISRITSKANSSNHSNASPTRLSRL